jgi:hypothetical protein
MGFRMTTAALPEGSGAVFVFKPIECLGRELMGSEGGCRRAWARDRDLVQKQADYWGLSIAAMPSVSVRHNLQSAMA